MSEVPPVQFFPEDVLMLLGENEKIDLFVHQKRLSLQTQ